jgi:hypothetical protein
MFEISTTRSATGPDAHRFFGTRVRLGVGRVASVAKEVQAWIEERYH